jgi:hypothetical protein
MTRRKMTDPERRSRLAELKAGEIIRPEFVTPPARRASILKSIVGKTDFASAVVTLPKGITMHELWELEHVSAFDYFRLATARLA